MSDLALSKVDSECEKTNTNHDDHFFEGAEKLLEIWFCIDSIEPFFNCTPIKKSLRNIPRSELDKMLEIARCHILHMKTNGYIDSYVLSESSMFISDSRFILKTCGTTDLLKAVPRLFELALKYAHLSTITNVYYSRKNFLRPHLQPHAHKNFDREVDCLYMHFKEGDAYCMGSLKNDRWYLYTMNNPHVPPIFGDHGLELLMSDVPSDVLSIYSTEVCASAKECTKRSGIAQLVPSGTIIHEELFDPVGYSMNGIIPDSDQYITIHVTPEKDFSYVSFETNQKRECLYKQTLKVLDCFRPNRIILIVFSNDLSMNGKETQNRIWQSEIPGYRRINLQFLRLQYDTLVYAQFSRIVEVATNHHKMRRLFDNGNDDDSNQEDSD